MFPFVSSIAMFFSCKKWLSLFSHVISPYLHGKLINCTSAFYLSFCCTVLPRILNISIFMNRVISVMCICQLYFLCFFVFNFTLHGIFINFGNQQVYYLINPYFFVACGWQRKSALTRYLDFHENIRFFKDTQWVLGPALSTRRNYHWISWST